MIRRLNENAVSCLSFTLISVTILHDVRKLLINPPFSGYRMMESWIMLSTFHESGATFSSSMSIHLFFNDT